MFEPKIETFIRCCTMKKGTKDLEELLAQGVDINELGSCGRTPLMETCRLNAEPAVVRFLLRNGADVRKCNKEGETALIVLGLSQKSGQNAEEVLCTLLNHGAEINESDNAGYTGLHNATLNVSNPSIIDVFLRHGGNLWQPDNKGITPADRICLSAKNAAYVKKCLVDLIDLEYMFRLFINNGRMASFADGWNKETVDDCVKSFLQKGLNINHQDKEGMTALMYFCKNNSTDIPQTRKNNFFEKIMYHPDLHNIAEVIKILVANGAETNLKNLQGLTAFDLCNNKQELMDAFE